MEKELEKKIRVIFFGSGNFAVNVLDALKLDQGLEISGIYTQIDKIAGRKGKLTPTALGKHCLEKGIAFERVHSVNDGAFLDQLRSQQPDLAVIVSFGQILKKDLLDLPRCGCLNVHSSLLPAYRGASPIATAILNGESVSGVTFMKMDEGLDTGGIYEQHALEIPEHYTTVELEEALSALAGSRIGTCIRKVCCDGVQAAAQDSERATLSRKIRKHHGFMDWNEDAVVLARKIRAFHPWPSVVFTLQGEKRSTLVKITMGEAAAGSAEDPQAIPGTILEVSRKGIKVACGKGVLTLQKVIPEGKREMAAFDFANGARVTAGTLFLNGPAENK